MTEREMVRALRRAGYMVLRPSIKEWSPISKRKAGKYSGLARGHFNRCMRGHKKGKGPCLLCRRVRDAIRHAQPEVKIAEAKRKREARTKSKTLPGKAGFVPDKKAGKRIGKTKD
jgi:hypothetical protein